MAYDPEYHRQYYLRRKADSAFKERRYLAHRRYVEKNRERIREHSRRQSREKVSDGRSKAIAKAWSDANPEKSILRSARTRARKYGRDFTITLADITIPTVCPILAIPLARGEGRIQDNSPTLDRIDPSKGYIPGNVWVISWRANRLKCDASPEELIRFSRAMLALFK